MNTTADLYVTYLDAFSFARLAGRVPAALKTPMVPDVEPATMVARALGFADGAGDNLPRERADVDARIERSLLTRDAKTERAMEEASMVKASAVNAWNEIAPRVRRALTHHGVSDARQIVDEAFSDAAMAALGLEAADFA